MDRVIFDFSGFKANKNTAALIRELIYADDCYCH